jgi:hypothetical protein
MTDEEIEVVAEELAKSGGTSCYPGRVQGPLMRVVTEHYREQACAVIAALDHLRTGGDSPQMSEARSVMFDPARPSSIVPQESSGHPRAAS